MKNRSVSYKGYVIEFVEYFYVVDGKIFKRLPEAVKFVDELTKEKYEPRTD